MSIVNACRLTELSRWNQFRSTAKITKLTVEKRAVILQWREEINTWEALRIEKKQTLDALDVKRELSAKGDVTRQSQRVNGLCIGLIIYLSSKQVLKRYDFFSVHVYCIRKTTDLLCFYYTEVRWRTLVYPYPV